MKCLIDYKGNGIIMDNIISVEWESLIGKSEYLENLRKIVKLKEAKGVIFATDVNNNTIVLGEYKDDYNLDDTVLDIMKWAANPEATDVFIMPLYETAEDFEE